MLLTIVKEQKIKIGKSESLHQKLELSWDKDMIGVLPVFTSYESALKHANGNAELIQEIES